MSESVFTVLQAVGGIKAVVDKFDSLKSFFKGDLKYGLCIPRFHIKNLVNSLTSENYLLVDLDTEIKLKMDELGENKKESLLDIQEYEMAKKISSTLEEITQKLNKDVIYLCSNYRVLKFVGCTKIFYFMPCKEMNVEADENTLKEFQYIREDLLNRKRNKLNVYNSENALLNLVLSLDLPHNIKLKF
jgi:hypothetical protein